ncbi:YveK family protein [Alkalibacterium olivapovliticus]|uniref:Capsular polysaccharide biosynthesis protein CpsC n=1 Tax=Alkalibacterium olivapovliticus TaxID=99907 RepID=A0A2T0W6Y4_9LACT|nr:Wzz/FepE/Etk N-terminal domain-containing protein [Alkalibacterium olivapovliticus]PRY82456.1 capsular polysaccharide biosynthesis protein [Alkalibacterium olivapovliticus]
MDEEISLLEFLSVLRKRLGLIVIGTLMGILIFTVYTFYIAVPQYSSTTQLLVNRSQETNVIQRADIETNVQLINTYRDMLRSPAILDGVREELNLSYSNQQLLSQLNISSENNSQVFSIQIMDPNPTNAAIIANTTANVFQDKLNEIASMDNVTVFSEANASSQPVSPNHILNVLIGLIIGGVLSTVSALLIEFADKTVREESFITDKLGLINLGSVSELVPEKVEKDTQKNKPERLPDSLSARTKI